ncbi:uncharacterized protein LOC119685164 [Teleopsis dalmanni]|uniref:uncharacterized protein LOC119668697 n=1 Tax=Teleopsis dalmanni TaxID=139649 RepID=UPI0018CDFABD|nr:uncharacterized protein LOC119668697 [Teleopsis dalmanni]XP_037955308.1 uncharacterized protein LOC119685164 [Teleopsis dalmanni]
MSFKRKRGNVDDGHFVGNEYSSTSTYALIPKILECERPKEQTKQNCNPFMADILEVKSIPNVTENNSIKEDKVSDQKRNPFEVIRDPPKKKKRVSKISGACFENRALNLNVPEKQFNPFEVRRENFQASSDLRQSHYYVNEALNIRSQDNNSIYNPFEVERCFQKQNESNGIENLGLVDQNSDFLTIKLPFQPTVGCRIDFKNISISELTPSKLLAEKLVFSPLNSVHKQSIGLVNEEAALDIGKELDRYQLELENSINEAKLRKNTKIVESIQHSLILPDRQNIFSQVLENVTEVDNLDGTITNLQNKNVSDQNIVTVVKNTETSVKLVMESPQNQEVADVSYESESDETNFKLPIFVRAYRRIPSQKSVIIDNPSDDNGSVKTEDNMQTSVKSFLRNSVRKLIHSKNKVDDQEIKNSLEKSENNRNIVTCIRQSLRRKRPLFEKQLNDLNMSIIDTGDRTMKLKSVIPETEYIAIEQLTNEKKSSLRNSLRHPTRELRHKLKKSLFQKSQEQYVLPK